ncbi:MAG TPA: 3D domain-containing protein [Kofleriaceae bacterium]|nr:3D domain-containing protein [Kofleriaceae bacterium]
MRLAVIVSLFALTAATARADDSKLAKEDVPLQAKATLRGKNKLCCGYPLVDDMQWALRFYWMVLESDYDEPASPNVPRSGRGKEQVSETARVDVYTPLGFFLGRMSEKFAWALRLEGSGLMADGRVINYAGKCDVGYATKVAGQPIKATCFEQLDVEQFPFGRGAGFRPLIPFKSVAIDPRLVPLGEPLYIPEFDGMMLPDGSIHDGCVRADDTGGGIKKRKMDFFVVTYGNFRFLLDQLQGVTWITPHVEAPRCEYLRER